MKCPILFRTVLLTISLFGISACGSDDDETQDVAMTEGENQPPNEGGVTEEDTDTGGGADTGDDVIPELTTATPAYLTSECGAIPLSDTAHSNSMATPTPVAVGQIVSSRVDPDSATNTEHYWSIDLQAGFYHMVFDVTRVDGLDSNLGLRVSDLFGPGEDDDVLLLRGNDIDFRIRQYEYIEVMEARTMTIRVTSSYTAADYNLSIIANGSEVPSPYFDDCPTINTLSLGSTEALTLSRASGFDDEQWYQVELELADYVLNSSATRTTAPDSIGSDAIIGYEFSYVDQFGQNDRDERVIRVNKVSSSEAASGDLTRSEDGPVWVRLKNNHAELDMEFSLQEEN